MLPLWAGYLVVLLLFLTFLAAVVWAEPVGRWSARNRMSGFVYWEYRPEEMRARLRLLDQDPDAFTRQYLWWGVLLVRVMAGAGLLPTAVLLWAMALGYYPAQATRGPRPDLTALLFLAWLVFGTSSLLSAFGWLQRHCTPTQIAMVAAVAGLALGLLLIVAGAADVTVPALATGLLTAAMAAHAPVAVSLNRKSLRDSVPEPRGSGNSASAGSATGRTSYDGRLLQRRHGIAVTVRTLLWISVVASAAATHLWAALPLALMILVGVLTVTTLVNGVFIYRGKIL